MNSDSAAEKRDPWIKFYPSDWRTDPELRMCSLAARGLWIELCGLMHTSERYGHLLVAGKPPTLMQIASLVGASQAEVVKLLAELEDNGVPSRTDAGVVYSRRMVRDRATRLAAKARGKLGGNPALTGQQKPEPKPPDKPMSESGITKELKLDDFPRSQKLEGSDANASGAEAPVDPAKLMFAEGKKLLATQGIDAAKAGKMLGAWRRDFGDPALISAIGAAVREGAEDPTEFIVGCLRRSGNGRSGQAQSGGRGAAMSAGIADAFAAIDRRGE